VGSATTWTEQVELEGADVVWQFLGGELDGCPAVTRNRVGAGTAWYAATAPDEPTMRRLFDDVLRECTVGPLTPSAPAGVKARRLQAADGEDHLIVLNHSGERVDVDLPGSMVDVLTGLQQSRVSLDRHGVAVLRHAVNDA
jgi:beta-galactosidase